MDTSVFKHSILPSSLVMKSQWSFASTTMSVPPTLSAVKASDDPREKAFLWVTVLSLIFTVVCLISLAISVPVMIATVQDSGRSIHIAVAQCGSSLNEIDSHVNALTDASHRKVNRTSRYAGGYGGYAVLSSGQETGSLCCIKGRSGPPGRPGKNGQPGAYGIYGTPGKPGKMTLPPCISSEPTRCSACPPGPPGPEGLRGPSGNVGKVGQLGLAGNPGKPGSRGMKGPSGPPGRPGQQGENGAIGQSAAQDSTNLGTPGPAGDPGTEGPPGIPGLPAPDGTDGFPGKRGRPGKPGQSGRPGPPGNSPPGPIGIAGENGACPVYCAVDSGSFYLKKDGTIYKH